MTNLPVLPDLTVPPIEITTPAWDNWEFINPVFFSVAWKLNGTSEPVSIRITKPDQTNESFMVNTGDRKDDIYVKNWPDGQYSVTLGTPSGALTTRKFSFGSSNNQWYPGIGLVNPNPITFVSGNSMNQNKSATSKISFSPGDMIKVHVSLRAWLGEVVIEVIRVTNREVAIRKFLLADSSRPFTVWTAYPFTVHLDPNEVKANQHYEIKASIRYRTGGKVQTEEAKASFYCC